MNSIQSNEIFDYTQKLIELKKYTKNMDVLIAEDHSDIRKYLAKILSNIFRRVDEANDGEEAIRLYKQKYYHIIFSDIVMPNINGIELAFYIKNENIHQNIIMFSAHEEAKYLKELLNIGVDKFITKPIVLAELFDAILSVAKDIYASDDKMRNKIFLDDNIYYMSDKKQLYVDENVVQLTRLELTILELFIDNRDRVLAHDVICDNLYHSGIETSQDNIRKYIYNLRKKIGKDIIVNSSKLGYKLESYS